jgi:hypothetical protein
MISSNTCRAGSCRSSPHFFKRGRTLPIWERPITLNFYICRSCILSSSSWCEFVHISTFILPRIRCLRDLKTGFRLDDRIYQTPLYKQALHKSLFHLLLAGHSTATIWADSTASPWLFSPRYTASGRTLLKTLFPTIPGGFTTLLPSNGRPSILARSYVAGLFTEPLPRNGSMRHTMLTTQRNDKFLVHHYVKWETFLRLFLACSRYISFPLFPLGR